MRHIRPADPTAPTTTAPSDNAGKVASFTGGVLTLTLNDGSTVAAKVTDATEISCDSPGTNDESGQGDAADRRGDGDPGDSGTGGDDEHGDNGGVDNDDGQATSCDSSSLVANAIVHEADIRITSTGATFTKVELVK